MGCFKQIIIILCLLTFSKGMDINLTCNSNGFQCYNETSFIVCVGIGDNILVPSPTVENCPKDFICVENLDVPCIEKAITTTTAPNIRKSEFQCKQSGKFPANDCLHYYQCKDLIFWFHLTVKSCPKNLWYNRYNQKCVTPSKSRCKLTHSHENRE